MRNGSVPKIVADGRFRNRRVVIVVLSEQGTGDLHLEKPPAGRGNPLPAGFLPIFERRRAT
jgi:hypothetical protein